MSDAGEDTSPMKRQNEYWLIERRILVVEDTPVIGVGRDSPLDHNVFGPYRTLDDVLDSVEELQTPYLRDGWRPIAPLLLKKGSQEISYQITERNRTRRPF